MRVDHTFWVVIPLGASARSERQKKVEILEQSLQGRTLTPDILNYINELSIEVIDILKDTIQNVSKERYKELLILQQNFPSEITAILEWEEPDTEKQKRLHALASQAHVKQEEQRVAHLDIVRQDMIDGLSVSQHTAILPILNIVSNQQLEAITQLSISKILILADIPGTTRFMGPSVIKSFQNMSLKQMENFCCGNIKAINQKASTKWKLYLSEDDWDLLRERKDFWSYTREDISVVLTYATSSKTWQQSANQVTKSKRKALQTYSNYFSALVQNKDMLDIIEILHLWPQDISSKDNSTSLLLLVQQLKKRNKKTQAA